jgi:hypothetical protein
MVAMKATPATAITRIEMSGRGDALRPDRPSGLHRWSRPNPDGSLGSRFFSPSAQTSIRSLSAWQPMLTWAFR